MIYFNKIDLNDLPVLRVMVPKLPKGLYSLSNVSNMRSEAVARRNMQLQSSGAVMSLCREVQCVQ